ncbi:cytochrome P450 4A10 [Colletotrichum tofieldiae]|uniref:Cytochrome P450 4A10 n=1 Tax=Colletotrichum tofieldiae TaxID=708197 RepID=A0A161V5M9_9PEZI|nr:cytochrome P450 4A10 [Colletotrichum tofieldiae]
MQGVWAMESNRLSVLAIVPLVLIPNDVDIGDGAGFTLIYSEKGGFFKAPCYSNFDFNGHPTIFSALIPAHRSIQAKVVIRLLSPALIYKEGDAVLQSCVKSLIASIKEAASSGKPVNMLITVRCLAFSVVTGHILRKTSGGVAQLMDGWMDTE